MSGCTRCGTEDELLFTCGHCDGQFCTSHQFPHHACSRFTETGRAEADAVGFEFGDGTTILDAPAPVATGQSSPAPDVTHVPGPRVEVARDAARETRPDREGAAPLPPNRGMPWEREGDGVAGWMAEQSYPGYLLKIGLLSLVFTAAYYAGLTATLYGYV